MTTPTVPVTVNLAAMGGPALPNITVTATLDANEVYNGVVVAMKVSAKTDNTGVAVLNLFPNAPAPTGLGTRGTSYRITATIPGGRSLNVDARVPNSACRIENILVQEAVGPLSSAELALLQAQSSLSEVSANAASAAASALAASGSASTANTKASEAAGSKAGADAAAAAAGSSASAAGAAASAAAGSANAADAARIAAEAAVASGGAGVDPDALSDVASLTGDERVAVKQSGNQRGLDVSVLQDYLLNGGKDAAFNLAQAISMAFGTKYGYSGSIGVGGGKVTQANNKAQAVTLDCAAGQVTLNAAALGAGAQVAFTLNNSSIAADDEVYVWKKGGGTAGAYEVEVDSVSAGSCTILVRNTTAGALSEALVIGFSVRSAAITPVVGNGGSLLAGMLVGMNIGGLNSYSGNYPFANLMHSATAWNRNSGSGSFTDNNGQLTATVSTDQFWCSLSDGGLGMPTGVFTVLNPQGAKIKIGNFLGQDYTGGFTTATNFTITIPTATQLVVFLEGSLLKTLGNLAVIMPGHAASYAAGNIWNQQFLDWYTLVAPSVMRFMDLTCTNVNIETDFSQRVKPSDIKFYSSAMFASAVPYELCIDLCNRLGRDMWLPVPVRYTDAAKTSMSQLINNGTGAIAIPGVGVTPAATGLASSRKWWAEIGNELWNDANVAFYNNTAWMRYFYHTKTLVSVNAATGVITHNGHPFANSQRVIPFGTMQARLAGVGDGGWYPFSDGGDVYIDLINANSYRLKLTAGGASGSGQASYPAGVTEMLIADPAQFGDLQLETNYGVASKAFWDIATPIMGAGRIKRLIGSQGQGSFRHAPRLAPTGVAANCDGLSIAPYFYGDFWMATADVTSSTSVTTGIIAFGRGAPGSGTYYSNMYAAGTPKPNDADVKSGAGAIAGSHKSLTYSNPATGEITRTAATTGLTVGTTYRIWHSYQPSGLPYLWSWSQDITITAAKAGTSTTSLAINAGAPASQYTLTTQTGKGWVAGDNVILARQADPTATVAGTVNSYNSGTGVMVLDVVKIQGTGTFTDWNVSARELGYNTTANQAQVNRVDIRTSVVSQINEAKTAIAASGNPAIPVVCYEGGNHMDFGNAVPKLLRDWLIGTYLESADYASVMNYAHHHMADLEVKLHCWYADVSLTVWSVANSYTDTTDQRALKLASYAGSVAQGAPIAQGNISASPILTAPTLPYTIATFTDPTLTYSIMPTDEVGAGNYDISGPNLRLISTAGINFASPLGRSIQVLASDGNRDKVVTVSFTTGDAWYEADSLVVFDSFADSNATQLDMVIGNPLPFRSGFSTPATIASGEWDNNGVSAYEDPGATVMTAALDFTKPIFIGVYYKKDSQPGSYAESLRVGLNPLISLYNFATADRLDWHWFANSVTPNIDTEFVITTSLDANGHIAWVYVDPATQKWYYGLDQTDSTGGTGTTVAQAWPTTSQRYMAIDNTTNKYGCFQVLNRAGLTRAQALAIVQKMQTKHGI